MKEAERRQTLGSTAASCDAARALLERARLTAFHHGSRPRELFHPKGSASGQASWDLVCTGVTRLRLSQSRDAPPTPVIMPGDMMPKPPESRLQTHPRAPPSLPRRDVPPRHVLQRSKDCFVTDAETRVNNKVTRYPASPAGGGCRASARQVGMCREGKGSPDRQRAVVAAMPTLVVNACYWAYASILSGRRTTCIP
jgi:hypothetical protein